MHTQFGVFLATPDVAVAEYGFGARHVYAAVFASDHGFRVGYGWCAAFFGLLGRTVVGSVFFALVGKDTCQQQAANDQYDPE